MTTLNGLDAWITRAPESSDEGDCDNEVLKECKACKGEGEVDFAGGLLVVKCAVCGGTGEREQECGGNVNRAGDGFACDSCDWTEGPDDQ